MHEKNIMRLSRFLHSEYPCSRIVYLGSGWSSIAFLVDECIIRFPQQNIEDYIHELKISTLLNKYITFETPSVEVILNVEFPYAKHRGIVGVVINDIEELCTTADQLAKDCAHCLAQIHNVHPITSIRKIPKESPINIESLERKLCVYFNSTTLRKLCLEYETGNQFNACESVFIHGDFRLNNMVLNNEGRLKGVFDWCNSGVGERERDFVQLYNSMSYRFIKMLFVEYKNHSMIEINEDRVFQLAILDMMNKLFWANENSRYALMLKAKLESRMQ